MSRGFSDFKTRYDYDLQKYVIGHGEFLYIVDRIPGIDVVTIKNKSKDKKITFVDEEDIEVFQNKTCLFGQEMRKCVINVMISFKVHYTLGQSKEVKLAWAYPHETGAHLKKQISRLENLTDDFSLRITPFDPRLKGKKVNGKWEIIADNASLLKMRTTEATPLRVTPLSNKKWWNFCS